jgi:hypothetical protein
MKKSGYPRGVNWDIHSFIIESEDLPAMTALNGRLRFSLYTSSFSVQRLVDFTLLPYDKSTSNRYRSSCFLYLSHESSSPYVSKRTLPPLKLSSSNAQRLVDFRLLPYDKSTSKSKKRSSCFLYLSQDPSSPYGAKRAFPLFC